MRGSGGHVSNDESAPVRAQAGERAGAHSAARSGTHSGTHSEATGEATAPGCVAWVRLAGWLDGRAYVVGPVWVWDAQVEYLLTALAPPGSALTERVEVSAAPGAASAGHVVDVMARQPGAGRAASVHEPHSVRGESRAPTRSWWLMRLAPASPDDDLVVSIRSGAEVVEVIIEAAVLREGRARQIRL